MRRTHNTGFTLIELMIVVAVLAIFASIAIPAFTTLIAGYRVKSAADEFHALLVSARTDAVTQRINIDVTESESGVTWSTNERQITIPDGVIVAPNRTTITFTANGTATASSTTITGENSSLSYTIETKLVGFIKKT